MSKLYLSLGVLAFFGLGLFLLQPQTQKSTPPSASVITQEAADLETFLKVNNASPEIAESYRFAQENPQNILSQVKCYCGCLKNGSGHKNNRDCFFNEDGSIDLMGLNCGLCVKTALVSKEMLAQGKSVQEISDYVDNRWGKDI